MRKRIVEFRKNGIPIEQTKIDLESSSKLAESKRGKYRRRKWKRKGYNIIVRQGKLLIQINRVSYFLPSAISIKLNKKGRLEIRDVADEVLVICANARNHPCIANSFGVYPLRRAT